MAKKQQQWTVGDIFAAPQQDGLFSVGQVLDLMLPHWVSCAFYDIRLPTVDALPGALDIRFEHLISAAMVARPALDLGHWKVIGHQEIALNRKFWPNDVCKTSKNWVGAKMHTSAVMENFLSAYYGLLPWDRWKGDPNFFDKLLILPERKPKNLIYKEINGENG